MPKYNYQYETSPRKVKPEYETKRKNKQTQYNKFYISFFPENFI